VKKLSCTAGNRIGRRETMGLLMGCAIAAKADHATPKPLARFLGPAQGAALLLDIGSRNAIASHAGDSALAPPGSTIKPFALTALLAAGKLTAAAPFLCSGKLTIAGRQLNCSHPPLTAPMRVETAIAYSCNCFVAHMAERFAPGEFASTLDRAGFTHGIERTRGDGARLQALGEQGILASAADLAMAYRWLALGAPAPVLAGLEGAVEYGTAQLARLGGGAGADVAGKTGTARTAAGNRIAWFAGFFPSRAPRAAIAVMIAGSSGGADAAPVAARILAAYRAGTL
jgi:cell division protein FtsI/penicillin-binding protein 2